MSDKIQVPTNLGQGSSTSLVPTLKSEPDFNGEFWANAIRLMASAAIRRKTNSLIWDNAPSTKRLKLQPIEEQSSASIVEEIGDRLRRQETELKNAEAVISQLKEKNTNLKAEKEKLRKIAQKYKNSSSENLKRRVSQLSKALAGYRKWEIEFLVISHVQN